MHSVCVGADWVKDVKCIPNEFEASGNSDTDGKRPRDRFCRASNQATRQVFVVENLVPSAAETIETIALST